MSGRSETRPDSVQAALKESVQHARRASAEALLAARSLLDAVSIALDGQPAGTATGGARAALGRQLDEWARVLESTDAGPLPADLAGAILEALEIEIARWEAQAQSDPEARAVLRAFLGLREILWELGIRADAPATATSGARRARQEQATSRRPRVQRVDIEG